MVSLDDSESIEWPLTNTNGFVGGDATLRVRLHRWRTQIAGRAPYYVPIISWLPSYDWQQDLWRDALAGITVAFVLIPQCLSYASQLILLQPLDGLYAAFAPLLIYAIFGTSKHFAAGPEALTVILTGSLVNQLPDYNERFTDTLLITFLVGIFLSLMGVFRLGFLDSILSRPLLRGFISAVAIGISIEQLSTLLGVLADHSETSPLFTLFKVIAQLQNANGPTALLSTISISSLWLLQALKRRLGGKYVNFPEILVVAVTATLTSYVLDLPSHGVAVLGDAARHTAFPHFFGVRLRDLSRVQALASPAALIAITGFVESTICVKQLAARKVHSISLNRELIALGFMNLAGSFFGAFPTFGSLARSLVGQNAGGRTQASGIFTALVILLTMSLALPLFYYLPKCVMAAIIFTAVLNLLEYGDVRFMLRLRAWPDLALCAIAFLTTLVFSLAFGLLISISLSLIIAIKHSSQLNFKILGVIPEAPHAFIDITMHADARQLPRTLVARIETLHLTFANTAQMSDRLRRIEFFDNPLAHPSEIHKARKDAIETVLLDMNVVQQLDASALQIMREIVKEHRARRVRVIFIALSSRVHDLISKSGIIDYLQMPYSFDSLAAASVALSLFQQRSQNNPFESSARFSD